MSQRKGGQDDHLTTPLELSQGNGNALDTVGRYIGWIWRREEPVE
jgi:hypothetical protein